MNKKIVKLFTMATITCLSISCFGFNAQSVQTLPQNNKTKYLITNKKDLNGYKYIRPLNIQYNDNKLLQNIVKNKWDKTSPNKILGKPDSYFNRYDIYFKKNIAISHSEILDKEEVISISGRIFNIVFNDKYNGNIINGITMASRKTDIIKKFGTPHFQNKENKVFGYKAENFYIFFVGDNKLDEVSIYRRDTDYNKDTIKKIINKYQKQDDEMTLVFDVAKDIDADWNTYNYKYDGGYKYSDRSSHIARGFLSQGVKLYYHYSGDDKPFQPFITIAGNFEGNLTDDISLPYKVNGLKSFKNDIIKLELDKDYIFDTEIERFNNKKLLNDRIKREAVLSPDKTMIVLRNDDDSVDPNLSGGYLIYLNKNKPNVEFKAKFYNPDNFKWISNRYIVYDVFKTGLFVYDINKNKSTSISDWKACLKSAKNGVIEYTSFSDDDDKIYKMNYRFDKSGNVTFHK